ncbi:hypothetical protein HN51_062411 [Arachis hypogaea]
MMQVGSSGGRPREPWHGMICKVTDENDPETWNVQVFRSIDSGSMKGFPKDFDKTQSQNLLCGKNLKVDQSIHTAYVKSIRSAQHFIYIENQYFLDSSYHWPSYEKAGRGKESNASITITTL